MYGWIICFDLPHGGDKLDPQYIRQRKCIPIPILIDDRHWYDPNPPDPRFEDLRILATIDRLAGHLSQSLGQDIQKQVAVKMGVTAEHFGAGVGVSRHEFTTG